MVFNTKNVKQIKRKNNWHLYLKLILYACECWSDSQRKDIFVNRTEQFHMSMCKKILDFKKCKNDTEVLPELGKTPLKVDIETKML